MADTKEEIARENQRMRGARNGAFCEDGRMMVHKPLFDDPEYCVDMGVCPECDGAGCDAEADKADAKRKDV